MHEFDICPLENNEADLYMTKIQRRQIRVMKLVADVCIADIMSLSSSSSFAGEDEREERDNLGRPLHPVQVSPRSIIGDCLRP